VCVGGSAPKEEGRNEKKEGEKQKDFSFVERKTAPY
jgi:hypothetical protein